MNFTLTELRALKENETFKKLQMFLFYNSLLHNPASSESDIAKKALIETGQQEVFRILDTMIGNLEAAEQDKGPMPQAHAFENLEYTGEDLEPEFTNEQTN